MYHINTNESRIFCSYKFSSTEKESMKKFSTSAQNKVLHECMYFNDDDYVRCDGDLWWWKWWMTIIIRWKIITKRVCLARFSIYTELNMEFVRQMVIMNCCGHSKPRNNLISKGKWHAFSRSRDRKRRADYVKIILGSRRWQKNYPNSLDTRINSPELYSDNEPGKIEGDGKSEKSGWQKEYSIFSLFFSQENEK